MSMMNSIKTNAIGLAIFAVFTAGLIAVTQIVTKDKIADNCYECTRNIFIADSGEIAN